MAELLLCQKDAYYDSVTLMTLSNKLKKLEGVSNAVVSMGTPMNKELLQNIGLLQGELEEAGPNDLLIAIEAETEERCRAVHEEMERLLCEKKGGGTQQAAVYRTISEAKNALPDLNLAVISVKGEFAAREAREALKRDMHVMLFSDNVTVAQELELKAMAHEKGLLVMGPDCGTAILGGAGLCFANAVRRGGVGLVAASGTGLQEVCVLVDRLGQGVSQAIGTGGRDLSAEIGGIMMLDGLRLLEEDPETRVIVLISKPPVREVAEKILAKVSACTKPVVVCFISGTPDLLKGTKAVYAASLEDAAFQAAALMEGKTAAPAAGTAFPIDGEAMAAAAAGLKPEQKYIRGLYCGGTLAAEAVAECGKTLSEVFSNVSKKPEQHLDDPMRSRGNCIIDLGDDVFTVGRPHPMIEPELRCGRIIQEAEDPETAVILMDFELGYGSNADPAGVTIGAVQKARQRSAAQGRDVVFIGYIQGTQGDFQDIEKQRRTLEENGVLTAQSNLHAVSMALRILAEKGAGGHV